MLPPIDKVHTSQFDFFSAFSSAIFIEASSKLLSSSISMQEFSASASTIKDFPSVGMELFHFKWIIINFISPSLSMP